MSCKREHLARGALLDRDPGTVGTGEVDRARGRRDVERDPALFREDGVRVGPDLVGRVAVRGDPVGAHDDCSDFSAREVVAAHPVRDDLDRDSFARELPGRQAGSLEERPGLRRQDLERFSRFDRRADDPESAAVAAGRERSGVAVRQHRRAGGEEIGAMTPESPRRVEGFAGDRVGFLDQAAIGDGLFIEAVGRVAARTWCAVSNRSRAVVVRPLLIAKAAPYAAATPTEGAPRTAISRIASATSDVFSSVNQTSFAGSILWSRRRSSGPSR